MTYKKPGLISNRGLTNPVRKAVDMKDGRYGFCDSCESVVCFGSTYLFRKCFVSSEFENRQLLPTRQPGISPRWASLRTVARWILSNLATCSVVRMSASSSVFLAAMIRPSWQSFWTDLRGRGALNEKKRARMRVAGASAKHLICPFTCGVK
jgi:hypothetical protein